MRVCEAQGISTTLSKEKDKDLINELNHSSDFTFDF